MKIFRYLFLTFVKITGFIPYTLAFKTRVYRKVPKKQEKKQAEIVVANHARLLDFAMLLFLYKFRVLRVMMAEVLYEKKLSAWFMKHVHGIRVDRKCATDAGGMLEARRTLESGGLVGIFPEGRLNKANKDFGEMLPFARGSVYLAITTGAKIRPVYLHGNPGLFKSSEILVGELLDIREKFGSEPTSEALNAANSYLRSEMEKLRDDAKLRTQHRSGRWLTRHMHWTLGHLLPFAFGIRYHYTDKAKQARRLNGPTIVLSNHTSYYDPPTLCATFRKDQLHMIAGEILYENKALGWFLNRMGCIRVDRNTLDMESFRAMSTILGRPESVGIFPEGALQTDGELHEFKGGFVLSAMMAGVPVLPVYIAGKYKFFRRKLHIWIDVPMEISRADMSPDGVKKETERVYQRMLALKKQSEEYLGGKKHE